jgi:competence protein ComGA
MEVNPHQGFHFEDAIKQVLRHDPNIIVIGEIRDPQEANAAFRCSLSGHLVLSTLHSNGLQKTLTRLIEFGIPKDLINQSLNAILYQELDYDTKTDKKSAKIEILNNTNHSICL